MKNLYDLIYKEELIIQARDVEWIFGTPEETLES